MHVYVFVAVSQEPFVADVESLDLKASCRTVRDQEKFPQLNPSAYSSVYNFLLVVVKPQGRIYIPTTAVLPQLKAQQMRSSYRISCRSPHKDHRDTHRMQANRVKEYGIESVKACPSEDQVDRFNQGRWKRWEKRIK